MRRGWAFLLAALLGGTSAAGQSVAEVPAAAVVADSTAIPSAAPAAAADSTAETPAPTAAPPPTERPVNPRAQKAGEVALPGVACCDPREYPGIVYMGNERRLTFEKLAAYCGPVLWFSPDEPNLEDKTGAEIRIPDPFPFEAPADSPVVYFMVRNILVRRDSNAPAMAPHSTDRAAWEIDLHEIAGIDIDYFFYYRTEEGLGGHRHDVESAQLKVAVSRRDECDDCKYKLTVQRVVGKAHGMLWYDNKLSTDTYTEFPIHILVEEGKHASCTDKNGDGYFTPGYDVNEQVNDAWGVRDVIRSGTLFAGGFEAWMAKVREDEHRVFPPLPEDSPLRKNRLMMREGTVKHARYTLRPFPTASRAEHDLVHFIADKGDTTWPALVTKTDLARLVNWTEGESFIRSFSVMYRLEGDAGISIAFPLLIVKSVNEPLAGGWLVNRVYFKDKFLRDAAWTILYTPSASRWVDGYVSGGVEWDKEDDPVGDGTHTESDFVGETGLKFRVNMVHTPLKFLTKITDFWGFRFGVKAKGFWDFKEIGYVFEIGAGTF